MGNEKFISEYILLIIFAVFVCAASLFFVLLKLKIKEIERQSKIKEMTDYETGIGNLSYFEHHFCNTISDYSRHLYYIAYIIVDGNYIQLYHGEEVFSDVVKNTASVLMSAVTPNEFAARISETGFAFAFREMNDEDAQRRFGALLDELEAYINDDSKPVFYASVYNLGKDDINSKVLLFNLRRNCNKIFGSDKRIILCDSGSIHTALEQKRMKDSVIRGLANREFKLFLQFIVDNKTKKIISAEALSRWVHPEYGILPPGKYIATMESAGLISSLDYYMFEEICKLLQEWDNSDVSHISLSCNFTRITLSEENFVDKIIEIAAKYNFVRDRLVIEITEHAIEKNHKRAMNNVNECKKLGFRIALDDLGSGYTSLANLCDYPIDIVKIDRYILLKTDTLRGKALFEGVIALSHSLNLKVVCEGVETNEHHKLVSATRCDYLQGWYYSKPIPSKEGEEFIRQYEKKQKLLTGI